MNDRGKRDLPRRILVGADCAPPERLAACELHEHLKLLGIDAPVVEADRVDRNDDASICLGAALLPAGATDALGRVRDDGFLLYRRSDTIHVAARLPRGTLFGCYQYLESLGVRWPEPGQPAELTQRTFELPARPAAGVDNPDIRTRGNNCYCPTNRDRPRPAATACFDHRSQSPPANSACPRAIASQPAPSPTSPVRMPRRHAAATLPIVSATTRASP